MDREFHAKLQEILTTIQSQIGGTWTIKNRGVDLWAPVEK
jgi:hypothetical protein